MSDRPRALDLFCGAGGVAMGLHRAGFDVTGVDIEPQPRYPFRFIKGDALEPPVDPANFDLVWASPVCKKFTRVWRGRSQEREKYPDQIMPARLLLQASGRPYVIENVRDAPLRADLILTGAMFHLPIVRDRLFEIFGFNVSTPFTPARSGTTRTGELAMIAGRGGAMKGWNRANWDIPEINARLRRRNSKQGWADALGIDWMIRDELAQAIPPAYSEYIGRAAISKLRGYSA